MYRAGSLLDVKHRTQGMACQIANQFDTPFLSKFAIALEYAQRSRLNFMEQGFTIQEVASITSLNVHTLRYYERIGLLDPIGRTDHGYRRYSELDLAWIEFVNRLRVTGMSIATMQEFASLRRLGDATIPKRRELLEQHQATTRTHMSDLQQNLRQIEKKIEIYKEMEGNNDT